VPELPEVEVVRRGLEAHVVGHRLADVEVLHPRPVRRHLAGADDFAALTRGRLVVGAERRGKYLWLPLDSGDAVLAHLGMSGQLLVQEATAPDERHLRVRFALSGGVFQNALLLRLALRELHRRGFDVMTHRRVPPNDGGIALGQLLVGNSG